MKSNLSYFLRGAIPCLVFFPLYHAIAFSLPPHHLEIPSGSPATIASIYYISNGKDDTIAEHYWVLKPYLDPQSEVVRTNPDNYLDMGVSDLPSENDPCNKGFEELCGIYVMPDPSCKTRPYFSESVNSDVYGSLKANKYLEGKVFMKDL